MPDENLERKAKHEKRAMSSNLEEELQNIKIPEKCVHSTGPICSIYICEKRDTCKYQIHYSSENVCKKYTK